jgi:hypothetical protein
VKQIVDRKRQLLALEICLNLYGVTIHFSVNNFDSNLPKFANLTQQITKFFDKCCQFENHGMSYLKISKF